MLYTSTRGQTEMVCSAHAITRGLADDGGLFVPQKFPIVELEDILNLSNLSYSERASKIISLFLTDYTCDELKECMERAYSKEKFSGFAAPVKFVKDKTAVLELWHGPTSAFKDMALQLLPYLMTLAAEKTGEENKLVILVATSGDTGKAALEGFKNVKGTTVIVFYPEDGVSDIQKCQMITQQGDNVEVIAVKGNFDDAQSGVKSIFADETLYERLKENEFALSSANSINWGRLVPQIVYYFSAYADAVKGGYINAGDEINFSVPTGNFGDILAGYYAKCMGLPVHRLICASNTNNVLADFFNTGKYDRRRDFHKTMSPSMDILISSNLERLLYHLTQGDAAKVATWMKDLKVTGFYNIDNNDLNKLQKTFFGTWVDEIETKETIGNVFRDKNYLLDPHTAVAWRACDKYRMLSSDERFCIVLSTASPYKFNVSVLEAIKPECASHNLDPFAALEQLQELTGIEIPFNLRKLETQKVLHNKCIEKQGMKDMVLNILNL
ncbi:MAG TPA: threonine synthase [Candidatus Dorea intestinavium]|nr:threonine synthase [Candidatus Dorea intestinavium]